MLDSDLSLECIRFEWSKMRYLPLSKVFLEVRAHREWELTPCILLAGKFCLTKIFTTFSEQLAILAA